MYVSHPDSGVLGVTQVISEREEERSNTSPKLEISSATFLVSPGNVSNEAKQWIASLPRTYENSGGICGRWSFGLPGNVRFWQL